MGELGYLYSISILWDLGYLTTDANVVKVAYAHAYPMEQGLTALFRLSSPLDSPTSRRVNVA